MQLKSHLLRRLWNVSIHIFVPTLVWLTYNRDALRMLGLIAGGERSYEREQRSGAQQSHGTDYQFLSGSGFSVASRKGS
jgi:hypothetical protein